jgi:hypothetical protein
MDHDPTRLLESAELSPTARALLESGRARSAVPYDVARGVARFRANLDAAPSGHALAARLRKVSKAAKLAVLVASCLPLLVPLLLIPPRQSSSRPPPAPPRAHASPQLLPTPPTSIDYAADGGGSSARPEVAPPLAEHPASVARAAEPLTSAKPTRLQALKRKLPAPATPRSHQRPRATPPSAAPQRAVAAPNLAPVATQPVEVTSDVSRSSVDSIDELRAIAQARRLVAREPQTALALLERVARAHPKGYFVEEREALRVLALSAAGQSDQAERYAQSFLRVYPHSPFADRIRTIAEH